LVVKIEYRVDPGNARVFHGLMQEIQFTRQRNGDYGWSIARDIADPELWTERYHCPTWLDYLRQRNRSTQSEPHRTRCCPRRRRRGGRSGGARIFPLVIPGHASSRGPGIHNHDRRLWIPGLRQVAHPGMTTACKIYCP
jgi:hypothetical protein